MAVTLVARESMAELNQGSACLGKTDSPRGHLLPGSPPPSSARVNNTTEVSLDSEGDKWGRKCEEEVIPKKTKTHRPTNNKRADY